MHIGCGVPITAAWVAHWQARAQQIELKKRMGKIVKQREHHWFDVQQKQLAEAEQQELQKAAKLKQKALKLAAEQKEQLEVYTQEYIKRLTDERLEGELVRKKALEEIEKDKLVEEARRRQARQNNLGTHTAVTAVAVCRVLTAACSWDRRHETRERGAE